MTQQDLLERVLRYKEGGKASIESLSGYERDVRLPTGGMLKALAYALNTSTDFLLELSDVPDEPGPSRYPAPKPEQADIVARLNDLPEEIRNEVGDVLRAVLKLSEKLAGGAGISRQAASDVRRAQGEQFDRLWVLLTEEEQDELIEMLRKTAGESDDGGPDAAGGTI